ncbi:MAG: 50S ribosomal protein L5 [Ignavibacteriae bacterium]|nr:50S ribosomal protein L5 [Ignavibacteriota bacterium]MCB9242770.1 50S ribosomal protein L5 [Ignavibacteriales bacterium]
MAKSKEERKKGQEEPGKQKDEKQAKGKKADKGDFVEEKVPARLYERYKDKIIPELVKKFNYKSKMQAPKLEKICINVGVGDAVNDPKLIDKTVEEIATITGQMPVVVKAKKSVSNFKLREGMNIGVRLTLRNARMYEFLDRFINIAVPRIRDFRGLSDKSFDGRGNYSIGIKEQIIFPEIDVDKVTRISGMDITFVTNAETDEESLELLKAFGVPFATRQTKAEQ